MIYLSPTICTGCGDNVIAGTGACSNCKAGASKRSSPSEEDRDRVLHAYFAADMKPKRIAKITGLNITTVRDICYSKERNMVATSSES